jgi:hypothetical protein
MAILDEPQGEIPFGQMRVPPSNGAARKADYFTRKSKAAFRPSRNSPFLE